MVVSKLAENPPDGHRKFEVQRPAQLLGVFLLSIEHLEMSFAVWANSFIKDKVIGLGGPSNGFLVTPYFSNKIDFIFPLPNMYVKHMIRWIGDPQFIAVHFDLFQVHPFDAAAESPADDFAQRAPV